MKTTESQGGTLSFLIIMTAAAAPAQNPPLSPTASTAITVTNNVLRYSSILIPQGVTVRFLSPTPSMPAVIFCDGDAVVHGSLSVEGDATSNVLAAGWVTTGTGFGGDRCTSSFPGSSYYHPPRGGRHAGDYGTVVPFSLDGGSPGGSLDSYTDQGIVPCGQFSGSTPGGQGGGTLVLIAAGRIEVSGTITADGFHPGGFNAGGSGGSVLLRGLAGVSILQGASVTARGGDRPQGVRAETVGMPGYIRLDGWGAPPDVQGTVTPAPTVLELPYLRVVTSPQIGAPSLLQVFAPRFTTTWIAVALQPGTGSTPFGELGIALGGAFVVGVAPTGNDQSHDPRASLLWAVPNAPALVGLPVWFQGLTTGGFPVAVPPRVTNTVPVVIL